MNELEAMLGKWHLTHVHSSELSHNDPANCTFCNRLRPLLSDFGAACAREARLEVLHRLSAHAWPDKTSYPQKFGVELRNALQDELIKAMDEVAAGGKEKGEER